MKTPNNVIDMKAWREKKAAEKAHQEKSQKFLDEIVSELAGEYLAASYTIQDIGDAIQRGHIEGFITGNSCVTKGALLCSLYNLGWRSTAKGG